ncbi:hypothetical protein Hdeb2414_s0003g00102321 [Helianthus debilis subsp. tardiflorus]
MSKASITDSDDDLTGGNMGVGDNRLIGTPQRLPKIQPIVGFRQDLLNAGVGDVAGDTLFSRQNHLSSSSDRVVILDHVPSADTIHVSHEAPPTGFVDRGSTSAHFQTASIPATQVTDNDRITDSEKECFSWFTLNGT